MAIDHKYKTTLKYNESQQCYYIGTINLQSVTKYINKHYNTLTADQIKSKAYAANAVVKKNKEANSGITKKNELQHYWKTQGSRSKYIGSATHAFMELYHINYTYNTYTEPLNGYEEAGVKAYHELLKDWDIISIEQKVYSEQYGLIGIPDVVLRHKVTKEMCILDWKTDFDVTKSRGKLQGTLCDVKNNTLGKAAVQLALYNILGGYDAPVANRIVVNLRRDGTYVVYQGNELPDVDAIVLKDLNNTVTKATEDLPITTNRRNRSRFVSMI